MQNELDFSTDRLEAFKLLKKNAPTIFEKLMAKKINILSQKIYDLRARYKNTEDVEEKELITKEGTELKRALDFYQSI